MLSEKRDNPGLVAKWRQAEVEGKKKLASLLLNQLVSDNLNLVRRVARRTLKASSRNPDNLEEAVQEGCIGLVHAVKIFDPSRGSFATVACFWIRHHVQTCMQKQGDFEKVRQAKMPAAVAQECNKIRTLTGREPSYEDVGVTPEQWDRWMDRSFVVSMQERCSAGSEADTVEDTIACEREGAEEQIAERRLSERIEEALATMSPRNRELTREIFIQGKKAAEVAAKFGISEVRVGQLRPVLERRLREAVEATGRAA